MSIKPAIDPVAASILQDVNDLPPIAYTYADRPDDVLEVRASELETIVTERIATFRTEFERLRIRIAELEAEVGRRREQIGQAFDAIDARHLDQPKRFTKYPCECGAMVSNNGHAGASHRRGSIHRQNMDRKALGLRPI